MLKWFVWDCKHVDIGACESKWFVRRYFRRLFSLSVSVCLCVCYQGKHGIWLTANALSGKDYRKKEVRSCGYRVYLTRLTFKRPTRIWSLLRKGKPPILTFSRCIVGFIFMGSLCRKRCLHTRPGKDLSWLKIFGFYKLIYVVVYWRCCEAVAGNKKNEFKARWAVYFCLYISKYLSALSICCHQSY